MNTTLKLAWRNIWRNRRRTLISMSAVALGLTLVLVYGSLIARMLSEAKDQLDNTGLGHVEITAKGWREHRAVKLAIADDDAKADIAKLGLSPTAEVGERLLARGLLSSAHGNEPVEVNGVDWKDEAKLAEYVRHVTTGALPADDDDKGVLIGDRLAAKMQLEVGNKVRLMVQRADGEMGADLFRVRGIYHAVVSGIAEHRVLVSRAALGRTLGVNGAHDIVIQLDRAADAAPLAAKARATLGDGVQVATYAELYPTFEVIEKLTGAVITFASFFVYFLVGLGIMNTMLMSVLERTRELGVMQALGTRPAGIVSLIIAESFWIATLSVVVGLVLGLGVDWFGSTHALLDYSKQMGESIDMGGAVVTSSFKTEIAARDIVGPAVFVYVMALVVGLYPAWRISRMRVVDAIHAK
jgi:ABC-type lipoprotein release transport system permease subunit